LTHRQQHIDHGGIGNHNSTIEGGIEIHNATIARRIGIFHANILNIKIGIRIAR